MGMLYLCQNQRSAMYLISLIRYLLFFQDSFIRVYIGIFTLQAAVLDLIQVRRQRVRNLHLSHRLHRNSEIKGTVLFNWQILVENKVRSKTNRVKGN